MKYLTPVRPKASSSNFDSQQKDDESIDLSATTSMIRRRYRTKHLKSIIKCNRR